MKQAIIDSREFWVTHKKDDAIEANKLTVEKIEAVEKMLSAATPTPRRCRHRSSRRSARPAVSATRNIA